METVIDKIKAHLLFTPPPVIAFPNREGEWGWSLSMDENDINVDTVTGIQHVFQLLPVA